MHASLPRRFCHPQIDTQVAGYSTVYSVPNATHTFTFITVKVCGLRRRPWLSWLALRSQPWLRAGLWPHGSTIPARCSIRDAHAVLEQRAVLISLCVSWCIVLSPHQHSGYCLSKVLRCAWRCSNGMNNRQRNNHNACGKHDDASHA